TCSFLSRQRNRERNTCVKDFQTDWFKTPFGVKQGDNDDLQNILNLVKTWCCRWRLSINQSKTQIIHFRKKGFPRSEKSFTFWDMPLENVSVYKYLGFPLDENMNYVNRIELLASSARKYC
uniref:Reverse transcriptase domain-containing protein n=1 Tax=Labrus bergylta TaxID=56723 RepID=A0A3Q3H2J8_9LABR